MAKVNRFVRLLLLSLFVVFSLGYVELYLMAMFSGVIPILNVGVARVIAVFVGIIVGDWILDMFPATRTTGF